MESKKYTVYMHICPNNKKYIGITCQEPEKRWSRGSGYYSNKHFYNAIRKYGWDNIQHKILYKNLTKEQAETKEIELIAKNKSNNRKYGYNIQNGGNTIGTHSDETKLKISIANKGKIRNQEAREKNSKNKIGNKNFLGHHHTEKTKKLLSELKKGNKNCLGRKLSQETKNKISISHLKSEKKNKYKKSIICIETNIKYNSIKEAGRILQINSRSIQKVCKGERQTAGKLHWKFAKEE